MNGLMRIGACLAVAGLTALAGCSTPEDRDLPVTDRLRTELPPAELPSYAKGDHYVFDNPNETWTVVAIEDEIVTWVSSLGGSRSTMFDPLLPPIQWTMANQSGGKRHILEWSGSLFPLQTGNKLTFKSAVQIDGQPGNAVYIWNCYAGAPRVVSVPAGDFAAFPVYCRRNDGQTLLTYYAPAMNAPVSVTSTGPQGESVVRRLVAFRGGKGARIHAARQESLPGGWAMAAVARDQEAAPRIAAAEIAAASPPVGLATPIQNPVPSPAERFENNRMAQSPANPATTSPSTAERRSPERFGAHLASYRNSEAAGRGWTTLSRIYKAELDGIGHEINAVDLGAPHGPVYRLVAAPSYSGEAATKLCRALKARDTAAYCHVVRIRD